jgi:serine/threonine protein kinase
VSRAAAEVGSTANSYQILAKLAAGGMAEIFLARGEGVAGVERYCVLKRILRDRASDVHFVRMFLDEARLAAQLQHANIAQVYDIGKLGDSYFFTMEYVHGETVRALLHRAQGLRKPLPIHAVLTIVAGAAAGLHHAHDRLGLDGRALGIVHRDVSPSNLMVGYEGGVKVVDFGVAKAADRAQETRSGTVKGKISYLSPEQCRGRRVDRRSDLFSLGICFWEMLTTERLFKRASDFENMNAIVTEDVVAPSTRRPDVPPEVDALVLKLLEKDPLLRFQTADELVEAIEGVAARTQTVLSASALGRLVRELFGQRPEPWLELESHQELGEAVTVTSEPIPRELVAPASAAIDQQLAAVVDLSAHKAVTESIEPMPATGSAPVIATKVGKLQSLGFPLAAPPPTNPGLDVAAKRPPSLAMVRPRPQLVDSPPTATEPLTESLDVDEISIVGDVAPPRAAGSQPIATPVVAPPPPPVGDARTASGPMSVSGPRPVVAPLALSASQDSLRASGAIRVARRRWPLVAVIGGAAIAGSLAVVLAMRAGGESQRPVAGQLAPAPTVVPIEPVAAPAPAATAAGAPTEVAAAAPTEAAPTKVAPVGPTAAGAAAPTEAAAHPVMVAAKSAPRPRPAPAPAKSVDELKLAFDARDYAKVRALCAAGPVTAARAPSCVLAACKLGDAASAVRLLAAVAPAQRDTLAASCIGAGVDVGPRPEAKPAIAKPVDCEADPMACQH